MRVIKAQGLNYTMRLLESVIEGNLGELNLEVRLEPCRLLLLGGSLDTSKEAITQNFDISL